MYYFSWHLFILIIFLQRLMLHVKLAECMKTSTTEEAGQIAKIKVVSHPGPVHSASIPRNVSSHKANEIWQNIRKTLVQRFRSSNNSKATAGKTEETKWLNFIPKSKPIQFKNTNFVREFPPTLGVSQFLQQQQQQQQEDIWHNVGVVHKQQQNANVPIPMHFNNVADVIRNVPSFKRGLRTHEHPIDYFAILRKPIIDKLTENKKAQTELESEIAEKVPIMEYMEIRATNPVELNETRTKCRQMKSNLKKLRDEERSLRKRFTALKAIPSPQVFERILAQEDARIKATKAKEKEPKEVRPTLLDRRIMAQKSEQNLSLTEIYVLRLILRIV